MAVRLLEAAAVLCALSARASGAPLPPSPPPPPATFVPALNASNFSTVPAGCGINAGAWTLSPASAPPPPAPAPQGAPDASG